MEHYGDVHLHQADYPGCAQAGACAGNEHNYYHGNQAKGEHPYDCHCNLCQQPYSLPYVSGPGGHLGGLKALKACGNPYCKCTDCDGNCRCGAKAMMMSPGGIMRYFEMKYILTGIVLGLLAFMLFKRYLSK
jgi:hypothetical protein